MSSRIIKPRRWPIKPGLTPPEFRDLWRDAIVIPMLEPSGDKVASFGSLRQSPAWTSTSTTGIERKVTTLGSAIAFNNPSGSASDQDYIEYNWLPNFGAMTIVVIVEMKSILGTNYYEQYVTQGAVSVNNSNFAVGYRHSKHRVFLYSKNGASFVWLESDLPSGSDTLNTPHVLAALRDANSNADCYWDGLLLPHTSMSTGTPGTSTAKLRIGSGTASTAGNRGVFSGNRVLGVALWPRRLSTEAIRRVTDDFFAMVTMADDYPAWMPAAAPGGFQPAWARPRSGMIGAGAY